MSDLVELTLLEAGTRLRRGETSSADLTEATMRHIEETEPSIRAYAHLYGERAVAVARQRDEELKGGRWRGPLHGIPIAIKDLLYTTDAPTEGGSEALRGFMAPYDATIVHRLRDAGAVIVGKTVTHELAYGVNVPPTRSPWGAEHYPAGNYPGGSSAGSGAAVAARSAFGAVGTDTGGSIREPASLNGLVGLKPTFGRVSRHGVLPLSPSLDHAGPMTRTVVDNALMLAAIAGYDPQDSGSIDEPVPDYLLGIDAGVRGMRLGIERRFFHHNVQEEVRDAVDRVAEELESAGAEVVEIALPELTAMSPAGLTILLVDASAEHRDLLRTRGHLLCADTRIMLELGEFVPGSHYALAVGARTHLQGLMRRTFAAHGLDALLTPTLPTPTVPMAAMGIPDETGIDPMTAAIDLMFPANVTGQPALTVPCGFSHSGLPIGVQIIGRPFQEGTVFCIARSYERNHDWASHRPPLLDSV